MQVVEEVAAMLGDNKRPDHDELDTYFAGLLRKVLEVKDKDHQDVCFNTFARN